MNHYCKRMRNWKEDKKPHQKKSRRYNRIAFIAITKWICAGSVRKFLSNESTIIRTPNLKNQRSRLLGTALCIAKCWKVDLNIQTYCTNNRTKKLCNLSGNFRNCMVDFCRSLWTPQGTCFNQHKRMQKMLIPMC